MNLEISSTLYVNLKEVRLNLLYLVYWLKKDKKVEKYSVSFIGVWSFIMGFPGGASGKEPVCQCR